MQRQAPKQKSQYSAAKNRRSGRTVFDKTGRGVWEWQTGTGVFEKHISDEQLAKLEDSQLTLLDVPPSAPVSSYYEWCESSKIATPPPQSQSPARGTFASLFKRFTKKT